MSIEKLYDLQIINGISEIINKHTLKVEFKYSKDIVDNHIFLVSGHRITFLF